jgi:hypothetical protein
MPQPNQLFAMKKVFTPGSKSVFHINQVRKMAAAFLGGVLPSYGNAVTRLNELVRSGYLIKVSPGYFRAT